MVSHNFMIMVYHLTAKAGIKKKNTQGCQSHPFSPEKQKKATNIPVNYIKNFSLHDFEVLTMKKKEEKVGTVIVA